MYDIATPVTVQIINNFTLSIMDKMLSFSLKIKNKIVKLKIFLIILKIFTYTHYIIE